MTQIQKMDPVKKELWCQALESGEYKQSSGRLKCHDGFCCLGVACELHRKSEDNTSKEDWNTNRSYFGQRMGLPQEVFQWLGFSKEYIFVMYGGKATALYTINDEISLSFKQISQLIREQL